MTSSILNEYWLKLLKAPVLLLLHFSYLVLFFRYCPVVAVHSCSDVAVFSYVLLLCIMFLNCCISPLSFAIKDISCSVTAAALSLSLLLLLLLLFFLSPLYPDVPLLSLSPVHCMQLLSSSVTFCSLFTPVRYLREWRCSVQKWRKAPK